MKSTINKIYRRIRDVLPANFIINKIIEPVQLELLHSLQNVKIKKLDINRDEYQEWVNFYFPDWQSEYKSIYNKKLFEFFATFTILKPNREDVFCDAAGGRDAYLHKLECKKKIIHDLCISEKLKKKTGDGVEFIESNIGSIPIPDNSLSKISCHHSFEHFQINSDILFILEVQRIMRVHGKCCIIPLLIANGNFEVTNIASFRKKFNPKAKYIIDPTATIPGSVVSGNYARIYDINTFFERVIYNIDFTRFTVTIYELELNGEPVPDLSLNCHKNVAKINSPYRAMVIDRVK